MNLFRSGFENPPYASSSDSDKEGWVISSTGQVADASIVHSGAYSLHIPGSAEAQILYNQFAAVAGNGPYYFRVYLRVTNNPNIRNCIASVNNVGNSSEVQLYLNTNGSIEVCQDGATPIGPASAVLSPTQFYRVEIMADNTGGAGAGIIRWYIDGTLMGQLTTHTFGGGFGRFLLGADMINAGVLTTGDWYFDTVAINDSTGSVDNGLPGAGKIIHVRPNAAGDINTYATQVGGTAGAANNFTRVNEVSPNDATSYNASSTLSQEDLFNCTDSGIGASDVVKFVSVGVRMADLVGADATAAIKVELLKASGGTKLQSSNIIPNSTTWRTNAPAAPRLYPLTAYLDPDGAAWTQATLDTMQIGYIQSAVNTRAVAVSQLWALIEYVPAAAVIAGPFPTHYNS